MKNIAIITGANSGLGKEFVKQINIQKLDEIWVIGFSAPKLEELKKEITAPAKILAMDLVQQNSIEEIKKLLVKEKPVIKWLTNAATIIKFGNYDTLTPFEQKEMIDINCSAMVELTSLAIPYMEKYSRIINIASVAGFQAVPYLSVYAASKAFVLNYTRGLRQELKPLGISVTCVCPYWAKTKPVIKAITAYDQTSVSTFNCMYQPKNIVVKAIKDSIKNKEISLYGFKTKLQHFLSKFLPNKFIIWLWLRQQKRKK